MLVGDRKPWYAVVLNKAVSREAPCAARDGPRQVSEIAYRGGGLN